MNLSAATAALTRIVNGTGSSDDVDLVRRALETVQSRPGARSVTIGGNLAGTVINLGDITLAIPPLGSLSLTSVSQLTSLGAVANDAATPDHVAASEVAETWDRLERYHHLVRQQSDWVVVHPAGSEDASLRVAFDDLYVRRLVEPRLLAQIEEAIRAGRADLLVVLAPGGRGKTSLVYSLWRRLSHRAPADLLPIFLRSEDVLDARGYWARFLGTSATGDPLQANIDHLLKIVRMSRREGRTCLVFADTIDRVLSSPDAAAAIEWLIQGLAEEQTTLVLSSRNYEFQLLKRTLPEDHLHRLDSYAYAGDAGDELSDAIRRHVAAFYGTRAGDRDHVEHVTKALLERLGNDRFLSVVRDPLRLRLVFESYFPRQIPDWLDAPRLYADYWARKVLCNSRREPPGTVFYPVPDDAAREKEHVACVMAWTMLRKGLLQVHGDSVPCSHAALGRALPPLLSEGIVKDAVAPEGTDRIYSFDHQSMFEYAVGRAFVARNETAKGQAIDTLLQHLHDFPNDFFRLETLREMVAQDSRWGGGVLRTMLDRKPLNWVESTAQIFVRLGDPATFSEFWPDLVGPPDRPTTHRVLALLGSAAPALADVAYDGLHALWASAPALRPRILGTAMDLADVAADKVERFLESVDVEAFLFASLTAERRAHLVSSAVVPGLRRLLRHRPSVVRRWAEQIYRGLIRDEGSDEVRRHVTTLWGQAAHDDVEHNGYGNTLRDVVEVFALLMRGAPEQRRCTDLGHVLGRLPACPALDGVEPWVSMVLSSRDSREATSGALLLRGLAQSLNSNTTTYESLRALSWQIFEARFLLRIPPDAQEFGLPILDFLARRDQWIIDHVLAAFERVATHRPALLGLLTEANVELPETFVDRLAPLYWDTPPGEGKGRSATDYFRHQMLAAFAAHAARRHPTATVALERSLELRPRDRGVALKMLLGAGALDARHLALAGAAADASDVTIREALATYASEGLLRALNGGEIDEARAATRALKSLAKDRHLAVRRACLRGLYEMLRSRAVLGCHEELKDIGEFLCRHGNRGERHDGFALLAAWLYDASTIRTYDPTGEALFLVEQFDALPSQDVTGRLKIVDGLVACLPRLDKRSGTYVALLDACMHWAETLTIGGLHTRILDGITPIVSDPAPQIPRTVLAALTYANGLTGGLSRKQLSASVSGLLRRSIYGHADDVFSTVLDEVGRGNYFLDEVIVDATMASASVDHIRRLGDVCRTRALSEVARDLLDRGPRVRPGDKPTELDI